MAYPAGFETRSDSAVGGTINDVTTGTGASTDLITASNHNILQSAIYELEKKLGLSLVDPSAPTIGHFKMTTQAGTPSGTPVNGVGSMVWNNSANSLHVNTTGSTWAEIGGGGGSAFTDPVTIDVSTGVGLTITQTGSPTSYDGLWVTDATAANYTKITNNVITLAHADGATPKPIIIQTKLSAGSGYINMGRTVFTDTTKALCIGTLLGDQLEIRNKTTWYTDSGGDGTITWTRNNNYPLGFIIGDTVDSRIGHIDLKAGATGEAGAVAYLAMESSDSTMYYLFFDNDGDLRMDSTKPVANGQGTVVGTQTA